MNFDFFSSASAFFGILLGSFANVIIYRLPRKESILWPGSHCIQCQTPIRFYDNIPLLSFLVLKGQCRQCKNKIPFRYFLVELLMGVAFFCLAQKWGPSLLTYEYFLFTFGLITASFIDWDHMILPDVFTLSGIGLGLLGSLLNPEREFLSSFLGVLVGGGFLWAVAEGYFRLKKKEGMGGGDIKLIAWIGAYLGVESILPVIFISSVGGALIGLLLLSLNKKGFQAEIPFGPYLSGAAYLLMLYPHVDLFFLGF